jgi:hypothetical protein
MHPVVGPTRPLTFADDILTNRGLAMNNWRWKEGWGLWFAWVGVSGVGSLVGFAVYFPLVLVVSENLGVVLQVLISLSGGAVLGASIGVSQRIVFRRIMPQLGSWVSASAAGGAAGGLLGFEIGQAAGSMAGFNMALLVGGALLGAGLGVAQWKVLQDKFSNAGWWVLASILGLGGGPWMGRVLGEAAYNVLNASTGELTARVVSTIISAGLMLLSYGAVSGAAVVWLESRSPKTPADSTPTAS